jgi:hypothetical protein
MRSPEQALAEARRRAQARPADRAGLDAGPPSETQQDSLRRLATWAMIEPDESEVYSTRRLGAPVTLVKKLLVRLLRQYLVQVNAQQSRFNAHLVGHLIALEERVSRLEELGGPVASRPAASPEQPTDTAQP